MFAETLRLTTGCGQPLCRHDGPWSRHIQIPTGQVCAAQVEMRPHSAKLSRAAGDMDGKRVWVRILKAVEELQRLEPGPGETAH